MQLPNLFFISNENNFHSKAVSALLIDEQKLLTLDSREKIYHLPTEHGLLNASSMPKLFIKSALDAGGNILVALQ